VGVLDGRVAVVTGAGRGLGREHALLLAAEGAHVVVNDLGGAPAGGGSDATPAEVVVEQIRTAGGTATASAHDVADWDDARRLVESTVQQLGSLDVLVNNAGILRDGFLVGMDEGDWDAVVKVHLKGHFAPLHFAARHWRDEAKAGTPVNASVINTSSAAGLFGNPGQLNYGAAKAGIATMTLIAAAELARYGVRVNAIAPVARTRLTEEVPGIGDMLKRPIEPGVFDVFDPANVAPLVVYLASPLCELTGQVYAVHGGKVGRFGSWAVERAFEVDRRPTIDELAEAVPALGERRPPSELF
jgi:NAD(P)-dependent dehydrogenase (short-subunit alcohol dehydrogenase family)